MAKSGDAGAAAQFVEKWSRAALTEGAASHHRYDVLLLINGVPVVQIELKTLGINPRRAIEQIVEYKLSGNG